MATLTGKRRLEKRGFVYMALIPAVIFFGVFFYFPFFKNLYWMFTDYNFLNEGKFVGMRNITKFLQDTQAHEALKNTLLITAISTPITLIISLFVAMGVFYLKLGKAFIRSAIFTTYIISIIVAAVVFKVWFGVELGFVNGVLSIFGISKVPWLTDPTWAMVSIIILSVWLLVGYFMVIFMAGLSNIDSQLYEASKIDGANRRDTFIHITLPQLNPVIVFSSIIAIMTFLKIYPQVLILTAGGPYGSTETILMYLFDQGFTSRNVGYASVIGFVLFLITLLITLVQMKVTKFFSE
ncbi:sugar ABC transporter permease [Paenibacillus terrigena]|uniref:carbohydrate ABC transporter permease n=1 Tax=Paenibacillus terrigena TaxID=369333 RepID=UPI0028D4C616|nr:sugar ABC transporter permease [Paenibacillus terrigena]